MQTVNVLQILELHVQWWSSIAMNSTESCEMQNILTEVHKAILIFSANVDTSHISDDQPQIFTTKVHIIAFIKSEGFLCSQIQQT